MVLCQEQNLLNFNGFDLECKKYMSVLNIDPQKVNLLSKNQFKALVSKQIRSKNAQDILDWSKPYKKIDYFKMKDEPFEMKGYLKTMTLARARTLFSLKVGTTQSIRYNHMSDKKYASELWMCPNSCNRIESLSHIAYMCPKYDSPKKNRDIINSDRDLADFFRDIVKMRDET